MPQIGDDIIEMMDLNSFCGSANDAFMAISFEGEFPQLVPGGHDFSSASHSTINRPTNSATAGTTALLRAFRR